MKVMQLISSCGFFGAENVLLLLAEQLHREKDCKVVVAVIKNSATPHLEVVTHGEAMGLNTAVFTCSGKLDIKTLLNIRSYVRTHKVDLVHSHGYKSNLYGFFATLGLPVKCVATCHNWLGDDSKMKIYAALDRFFLRRFAHVVAVSQPVREELVKSRVSGSGVSIISNGINLSRFSEKHDVTEIKRTLGIAGARFVLGAVGRISSEKGHAHLLSVVRSLQKQFSGVVLLLVGDGDQRMKLERMFHDTNVVFTGLRNDLPELYKCMDIFVLPSLTEGLPMVLLEAMATGLPVVATRVGDVPRVIINGKTGFIVDPGDEKGLETSLVHLIVNPQARKKMGAAGVDRVEEHFSAVKMAKQYMQMYKACLRKEQ